MRSTPFGRRDLQHRHGIIQVTFLGAAVPVVKVPTTSVGMRVEVTECDGKKVSEKDHPGEAWARGQANRVENNPTATSLLEVRKKGV